MLTEKIRYFHQTSRDTYGSPRICEDLVRAGEHIGKNTVALLMQRAGIVPKTVPAPNRLEREFVAKHPNQRWVSDITFIPIRQGWLYLAVIIDLYSRAVIGWAMHKRMKTELVHHEDYRSRTEAKASIFEYIEVFYNRQRRHSHIGQMAPLAFEKAAASR